MPLLLEPGSAPTLDALLAAVDTAGLTWHIVPGALPADREVRGVGTLAHASGEELSFLTNTRYQSQLRDTRALAVLVDADTAAALQGWSQRPFSLVVTSQPYLLYARVAQWLDRQRQKPAAQAIHPSAVVDPAATVDPAAQIGPMCVIEAGARIERGAILGAGCVVGAGSIIGVDCLLHARVTLYAGVTVGARTIIHSGAVLGADGFGFAPDRTPGMPLWCKIPQVGGVTVGDDVEIGANTTIDRGALEDTVIGHGVKLDNQIMVAHNVRIGEHTAIAACVGIAGSTTIGARCTIAGAAMLQGHIVLADDVHISGATAVTSSIHKPGRYTGLYPYAEHKEWQRNAAVIQQLGELRRRVRTLSKP